MLLPSSLVLLSRGVRIPSAPSVPQAFPKTTPKRQFWDVLRVAEGRVQTWSPGRSGLLPLGVFLCLIHPQPTPGSKWVWTSTCSIQGCQLQFLLHWELVHHQSFIPDVLGRGERRVLGAGRSMAVFAGLFQSPGSWGGLQGGRVAYLLSLMQPQLFIINRQ